MLSNNVSTKIIDLDRNRNYFTHWNFSSIYSSLLIHYFKRNRTSSIIISYSTHHPLPFFFPPTHLLQSFRNIRYRWCKIGLIRRKNKFVVVYAITITVYMISFLVLAIFVTRTPGFISSQCETSNGNEYN